MGHLSGGHTSSAYVPPGILELALSNEKPRVSRAVDGSIRAATLEGLVEQLVTECYGSRKARDFMNTFFTTYTAFTTADEVFQRLFRRFQGSTVEYRVYLRIDVINVMKYWVENLNFEVNAEVLDHMKSFASSIQWPEDMKNSARTCIQSPQNVSKPYQTLHRLRMPPYHQASLNLPIHKTSLSLL